tara:strand:- start:3846 stop:4778 length:933 start_codon:yes stop_codon:yes gene_type:complete
LNCHFAPLEQEALLHIAGPDTLKFLQGQTTCDTRKVDSRHATPGLFCTPQGRVICDFLLFEVAPEHVALRLRRDIRQQSAASFGKYIIFSKANIDASSEDHTVVAVWGEEAASVLQNIFGEIPTERFGAICADTFALVQTDERGHHFECFLHKQSSGDYLSAMDAAMPRASEAQWQAQQITDGIARIETATVSEFVPQVLNYDLTGHISFKKGCYTGQEVVARLHYLGKSKRRTYTGELCPPQACATGTAIFDANSGQSLGSVVNSAEADGKTFVLVTASTSSVDNELRLGAADGPLLTLLELPYTIATD